jgi:hypothetical protein
MADHFPCTSASASHRLPRRLVAVGTIRHLGTRTFTMRATEAGVTGMIRQNGGAR